MLETLFWLKMEFEKKLKELINSDFCLVGNSPIEIGKGKGSSIDRFSTVVRFNDYSLKYPKDYGSKVNIWVRATNDLVLKTIAQKNNFKHQHIFLRASSTKNQESRKIWEAAQQEYSVFPISYEGQLSKKLGAIPSTGLLFIYILKTNGIPLQNFFGFSFFDAQDIVKYGSHHYFEKNRKLPGRHLWEKEKNFFNKEILELE